MNKNIKNARKWTDADEQAVDGYFYNLLAIAGIILAFSIICALGAGAFYRAQVNASMDDNLISHDVESYIHRYHEKMELWDLE